MQLKEGLELVPLGLKSRSQEAVLNGELLRVDINVLHLRQMERQTGGGGYRKVEDRIKLVMSDH